jgi:hypothetical protein
MKTGIFIAMTAMGLALLAVPEALGWWGHGRDLNQRFVGQTATIETEEDETGAVTTLRGTSFYVGLLEFLR